MLHKKYVNRGFTLVELLSVIVILAIILVIAVPKIMSVITDSKKSSLETSAKMIASTAEKTKVQKELLGEEITGEVDCSEFTKVTSDYESCTVKFDGNTAKVNITGANKFEGLSICNADKNNATAQTNECINAVSFAEDSWETIITAVKSGVYPYNVGDTKEVELSNDLGTHTLRIANKTSCEGLNLSSQTACGFVLEFADVITSHVMNSTATNVGGWPASEMRTYVNNDIYNALPEELKDAIIYTTVVSSHGSTSGEENFTSTDKLYLLSGEEIYEWYISGEGTVGWYGSSSDTSIGTSRQLDYYKSIGVTASSYSGAIKKRNESACVWGLRSVNTNNDKYFYIVDSEGFGYRSEYADAGRFVAPAFRLAE